MLSRYEDGDVEQIILFEGVLFIIGKQLKAENYWVYAATLPTALEQIRASKHFLKSCYALFGEPYSMWDTLLLNVVKNCMEVDAACYQELILVGHLKVWTPFVLEVDQ